MVIGIETERGPWVQALLAAGYRVHAINPLQVARYRERQTISGAKSDAGDAHALAAMVRTDGHQLRTIAGDSDTAAAVKVVARAHKTLVWERTRHMLRLRTRCGTSSPTPSSCSRRPPTPPPRPGSPPPRSPPPCAAHRRNIETKAAAIRAALRTPHLTQAPALATAYAAVVRYHAAILGTLRTEITALQVEVETPFARHPAAQVYLSQPGLGPILAARVLAEFGDDPTRYDGARARKNYAGPGPGPGPSPITRASGKSRAVHSRHVHNDRLCDALGRQAYAALSGSPGARAYYDPLRVARSQSHGCRQGGRSAA